MAAYDDMISGLLNAGGLTGQAFAQGQNQFQQHQLGAQQLQEGQMQIAAAQTQQARAQQYQSDVAAYSANPSAQGIAQLIAKYPEQAKALKESHDAADEPVKQGRLNQWFTTYNLANKGDAKNALAHLDGISAAEKQAGLDPTEVDSYREGLSSTDPTVQQAALKGLQAHTQAMISITDPEKAKALGLLGDVTNHFSAFGTTGIYDQRTGKIVREPDDKAEYQWDPANSRFVRKPGAGGGGPASSGPGGSPGSGRGVMSPKATAVAGELTAAGLPPAVVAGFMGNFHIEGGYDGAQGDGGSASGIAQWHHDRADTFQRVIGKPVTEATPAEQARFVAWEMQNPQAAGMTVAKRDAILAATTPAQAAALIDQHYERSDGKSRAGRMSAATAFANQYSGKGGASGAASGGDDGDTSPGAPEVINVPTPGGGALTGDALDAAAFVYNRTGIMPTALGRQGVTQKAILNRAAEIRKVAGDDPNTMSDRWQEYKMHQQGMNDFAKGPESRTTRSLDVSVDHLHTLQVAAQALQNGNIPLFNRVKQFVSKQSGDAAPTNFEGVRAIVSAEVAKAITGGVTALADRQDLVHGVATSGSPQQLAGYIAEIKKLMAGQLSGLNRQYQAATGRNDFGTRLSPNTRQVLGFNGAGISAPSAPSQGWGKVVKH